MKREKQVWLKLGDVVVYNKPVRHGQWADYDEVSGM